jgi:hypothetical protein
MTTALELEFEGEDLVIEDPSDQASWIKGFDSFIQGWASEHYTFKHEYRDNDFDKKTSKSLGESIARAMQIYREEVAESNINNEPFTAWEHVLADAVSQTLHGEFHHDNDGNDEFLYSSTFEDLYSCIDEAMSEHDGPVCDLDELVDEIRTQTRYKMEELDTSTIYDEVGGLSVTLMHVPGFNPETGYIDDFDINSSEISTRAPGMGHQALLNLIRVSIPDLMELVEIDQDDSGLIDAWLDLEDPVAKGAALGQPVTPLFSSVDGVKALFENTNGYSGVLPCWVGSVKINDLKKIDPTKSIELSGGIIALTENANGAGYYESLEDSAKIVIDPSGFLIKEYGYTVMEIFDMTRRSLEAKISIYEQVVPTRKAPENNDLEPAGI